MGVPFMVLLHTPDLWDWEIIVSLKYNGCFKHYSAIPKVAIIRSKRVIAGEQ